MSDQPFVQPADYDTPVRISADGSKVVPDNADAWPMTRAGWKTVQRLVMGAWNDMGGGSGPR